MYEVVTINFIEYMDVHSRILELANNLEIKNSQNKSLAKISEFAVTRPCLMDLR